MGGNPRPAFLPIRSEHFPDADGVLAFLYRQPGGLLAVVKFAHLFSRRFFRFVVTAKGQHPAFASRSEADAIKRESFCGLVDFGSLVVILDCDGKLHSLIAKSRLILCKFCAKRHRIIDFIGINGSRGRTRLNYHSNV